MAFSLLRLMPAVISDSANWMHSGGASRLLAERRDETQAFLEKKAELAGFHLLVGYFRAMRSLKFFFLFGKR